MAKTKRQARGTPSRKGPYTYKGLSLEQLQELSLDEFIKLIPARQRRTLTRGFTERQNIFLKRIRKGEKRIRTHLRDMIVLPEMAGLAIEVHNGKEFHYVEIQPEMIGHYLGEFAQTRGRVRHGSAGIGATRSSKFIPLK